MLITKLPKGWTKAEQHAFVNNREYDGNLQWRTLECLGPTRWRVSLRVKNGRKYGARLSASGRHSVAASWEAFRDFLAEFFAHFPQASIVAGMVLRKLTLRLAGMGSLLSDAAKAPPSKTGKTPAA